MRISDWSSDVCSSDLTGSWLLRGGTRAAAPRQAVEHQVDDRRGEQREHLAEQPAAHHDQAQRLAQLGARAGGQHQRQQIGRASCWERVCHYVSLSVVVVSSNKKNNINTLPPTS